jgi:hypothetical protein
MAAPAVLLIELLDAVGAHEADAALRLRTLRAAGLAARTLVLDTHEAPAWREVAARVVAERPSAVWIAGSSRSWAAFQPELPAGLPRVWWPTVVPDSGGEPPACDGTQAQVVGLETPVPALDSAPVRDSRDRAPVALWDGEFVLVPGPLEGGEGDTLLKAFATASAERPELELVVLAEPEAQLAAAARALGLAWRVHFAGPAPREAEHTWLATAAAVLLPTSQPVSAGLVLRTLAVGTPLVVDTTGAGTPALRCWLEARAMPVSHPPDEALEAVLARESWVREACARGRMLAELHGPDALAARLGAIRGRSRSAAREAA